MDDPKNQIRPNDPTDWMGPMGECKSCGGEIPHGHHIPNCFVYPIQQRADRAERMANNMAADYYEMAHLLANAKCPDPNCDGRGTSAQQVSETEWEPMQCEWCHSVTSVLGNVVKAAGENFMLGQKSLDPEIERVLYENLWEMYS